MGDKVNRQGVSLPDVPSVTGTEISNHVRLQAMALDIPDVEGHPNRHPFSGILTRIDQPSDKPPSGSPRGNRVIMTTAAARAALPSLLGMAIDYTKNFDGHDAKSKIGVITSADIVGNEIKIGGFFYAADFPNEVKTIRAMKDVLGFSWEIANIWTPDVNADPMVIIACTFTGAAVLKKNDAAYSTTSIQASATKEIKKMDKEQMDALMASVGKAVSDAVAPVAKRMDDIEKTLKPIQAAAHHVAMVDPHANALESCAAAMEKAGIGGHPTRGHVAACMAMAGHLRAAASKGELASEWPGYSGSYAGNSMPMAASAGMTEAEKKDFDALKASEKEAKDRVSSLETKIKDLQAAATKTAPAPDRKTLTPAVLNLMAKAGFNVPEGDAKLTVADVDNALSKTGGLTNVQRMEVKNGLNKAGLLSNNAA